MYAFFSVLGGLITAIISALSPRQAWPSPGGLGINRAVSAVNGACIWLLVQLPTRMGREVGWLHRYSGSFAQLLTGEAEPRVAAVANGIFLPHVIAHAAARHGIEVRHYRGRRRG